jgi:hypothetical protein
LETDRRCTQKLRDHRQSLHGRPILARSGGDPLTPYAAIASGAR